MDISMKTTGDNSPLNPVKPDGYTDTGVNGARWDCDRCGAHVTRTQLHDDFHDSLVPDDPPGADDYDDDEWKIERRS